MTHNNRRSSGLSGSQILLLMIPLASLLAFLLFVAGDPFNKTALTEPTELKPEVLKKLGWVGVPLTIDDVMGFCDGCSKTNMVELTHSGARQDVNDNAIWYHSAKAGTFCPDKLIDRKADPNLTLVIQKYLDNGDTDGPPKEARLGRTVSVCSTERNVVVSLWTSAAIPPKLGFVPVSLSAEEVNSWCKCTGAVKPDYWADNAVFFSAKDGADMVIPALGPDVVLEYQMLEALDLTGNGFTPRGPSVLISKVRSGSFYLWRDTNK